MVDEAVLTTAGKVMPMVFGDAALVSMSMAGEVMSMLMVGEAMSMSMVGEAMSMSMTSEAIWTAVVGDEPLILVDAGRSVVVGEGAGESVDPYPTVPTVGAN
jgi:hypothetical protein